MRMRLAACWSIWEMSSKRKAGGVPAPDRRQLRHTPTESQALAWARERSGEGEHSIRETDYCIARVCDVKKGQQRITTISWCDNGDSSTRLHTCMWPGERPELLVMKRVHENWRDCQLQCKCWWEPAGHECDVRWHASQLKRDGSVQTSSEVKLCPLLLWRHVFKE